MSVACSEYVELSPPPSSPLFSLKFYFFFPRAVRRSAMSALRDSLPLPLPASLALTLTGRRAARSRGREVARSRTLADRDWISGSAGLQSGDAVGGSTPTKLVRNDAAGFHRCAFPGSFTRIDERRRIRLLLARSRMSLTLTFARCGRPVRRSVKRIAPTRITLRRQRLSAIASQRERGVLERNDLSLIEYHETRRCRILL